MMDAMSYTNRERRRAVTWKATTACIPEAARRAARYVGKDGREVGPERDFCLPAEFADLSLLPEVRVSALDLFSRLEIPWHAAVGSGPSNHLLSSQVQCVNALGQMVFDPERLVRAFRPLVDTDNVEEIEPNRWLTFEYIGEHDVLNEAVRGVRRRGSGCTSVDAAFVHTTRDGVRELVLIEWKYTEHYRPRRPEPMRDRVRCDRYSELLASPDSPVNSSLVPIDELFQEPIYQLVRQQLLAHELEKRRAHGAERVRIVHVLPAENDAYDLSMFGDHMLGLGSTVKAVWRQLLRSPDRFIQVDSKVFAEIGVTSPEYCLRYGGSDITR